MSRSGIVVALIIAAVFCLYLATITAGMPPTSTDWAMYVMHARNILQGRPYTDTGYIVRPETAFEGANSYPSGYPLLLVPVYAAFGFSVRAFKIVSDAALALSLLPIYLLGRRFLSSAAALLIVLATAFGWLYMNIRNSVNSDGPYQLLSFAAIVLALWIDSQGKTNWPWGLLAGLVAAAAYLTRPIGVAIVIAVIAAGLLRRRRVSAFAVAMLVTFVALVLVNNSLFHKDSAYKDQFVFSPVLIVKHAIAYLGFLSHLFANPFSNLFRYLLWIPSMLLAVAGIWTSVRKYGLTLLELYWVIVLGVLSLYWVPNARYLLPLMPIFLIYIFIGAEAVLERIPPPYRPALRVVGAALLLIAPAANLIRIRTFNQDTLIATPAFDQLCQQLAARTTAHDYVLFWSPRVLALYTGRPSSAYPFSDPPRMEQYFSRVQPSYIVLDKNWGDDRTYLQPVLDSQPRRYLTVYENSRFKLAQVVR